MMVQITQHARKRIKERIGIKGEKINIYANKAYVLGNRGNDIKKISLDALLCCDEGIEPVIFLDQIWLFNKNKLITVFPMKMKDRKRLHAYYSLNNHNKKYYRDMEVI